MFESYLQILWLKLRHVKTQFTRVMYVTGSDFASDGSFIDRTYQVYVLLAIIVCAFFTWVGFLAVVVSDIFVPLGVIAGEAALHIMLLLPGILLLLLSISCLRSSPLKFSHADISFIAASPVPVVVPVHIELAGKILLCGALGFLFGDLLGVGIHAVLSYVALPLEYAALSALLFVLVYLASWLLGLIRLLLKVPFSRIFLAIAITLLCFIMFFLSVQVGVSPIVV